MDLFDTRLPQIFIVKHADSAVKNTEFILKNEEFAKYNEVRCENMMYACSNKEFIKLDGLKFF